MFKTKCNDFLEAISQMRESAIEKDVQEALKNEHEPYVDELIKTKQLLILEETEKVEDKIRQLREGLAETIASYEEKTRKAIEDDKANVMQRAKARASESYDSFILGVSKLVDDTKIN